jgi:hypothetical protein
MRFCALMLILSGCGGPSTTTETANDASEIPSPPQAWEEMDHEAKASWMGEEVMPRMSAMFQEHDGEEFANFGCRTCHGPGARERNFEMPSPHLPALPATGTPEQEQMVREYEPMLRFMFSRVVPTMQTLLGAAAYDEETHEGFSCYACHPHAGDEGTTLIHLGGGEGHEEGEHGESEHGESEREED